MIQQNIQHLSMLVQDSSQCADIVAQCIEEHIRTVPPWMKLFAFYLLDAISKNVYELYAHRFSSFVVPLFLESYFQVDESTRGKMEEMLLTWRTGSPSRKELFGVHQQVAMERGIWGDGGLSNSFTASPSSGFHSGVGRITKSQVLSELQFTLGQKERAVLSNPYDTTSQSHIDVLRKLRKLVEAGVSQNKLREILTQLRNVVKSSTPTLVGQPALPPVHNWSSRPPFPQHFPQVYPQVDSVASTAANVNSSTPMPNIPANVTDILSSLLKAGVLSTSGLSANVKSSANENATSTEGKETKDEAFDKYRSAILSVNVDFSTLDLVKSTPRIREFLCDRLSSQYKQCGIRFPDTKEGKKTLDDHLDMHFRQNRSKANQKMGLGYSRSWFIGIEDWIQGISIDQDGKGRADGSGSLNARASAAAEDAKREAELQAQYVIVPLGNEAQIVSCSICKETLMSEFLEDDEDWVYKNAVKKDDKIFHATCHAQTFSLTKKSFEAKLWTEKLNGSRSTTTPEVQSISTLSGLQSTSPPTSLRASLESISIKGTKRKVDDHEDLKSTDEKDLPPLKKIALNPRKAS